MTPINSLSLLKKNNCNDFEIIPNKEKSGVKNGGQKISPTLSGICTQLSFTCGCYHPQGGKAIKKIPEKHSLSSGGQLAQGVRDRLCPSQTDSSNPSLKKQGWGVGRSLKFF